MNKSKTFFLLSLILCINAHASHNDAPPSYAEAIQPVITPQMAAAMLQERQALNNRLAASSQPAPDYQSMEIPSQANQTTISDRANSYRMEFCIKPYRANPCMCLSCALISVPCQIILCPFEIAYVCCNSHCAKKCLNKTIINHCGCEIVTKGFFNLVQLK